MNELFQAAFSSPNIVFTVLLIVVMLYWLTVFVGLLDLSMFDIDIDLDAEVEPGALLSFLAFFNLGKVPFMVFLSFLSLSLWVGAILGNHYIGNYNGTFALLWTIPNLAAGLLLTKAVTHPLNGLMKDEVMEFSVSNDVIGKVGMAMLPLDADSVSQVQVPTKSGAPLLLRAQSADGQVVAKGEKVLVVFFDEAKKLYLVEPYHG